MFGAELCNSVYTIKQITDSGLLHNRSLLGAKLCKYCIYYKTNHQQWFIMQ